MKKEKRCERCQEAAIDSREHFCPECRAIRLAERRAANNAAAKERWLATEQYCERCGASFVAANRRRMCDKCADPAERMRQAMMRRWQGTPVPTEPTEDKPWRREDGVLVLPPAREQDKAKPRRRKPGAKVDPQSLEAVLYRLEEENERRAREGKHPLSYGQFVAQQRLGGK